MFLPHCRLSLTVLPKVCDDRHSELIPCLDRNLIYQMRLKLDLSLMEHYERHCPQPERRYNCLIPPPPGYKVRMPRFFSIRDELQKFLFLYIFRFIFVRSLVHSLLDLLSSVLLLQVPIKWPKSRDEVWKANIPHTHLAHEKSDQNWMVVKGEKIVFPGGGTHFHYGADKYIASLANVRLTCSSTV